jgi:hypothetical protein
MVRDPGPGLLSRIGRVLRTVLWAILFAFAFGFVVGTVLRAKLDRPVRYIGARPAAVSVLARAPRDVGDALPRVLMTRDHEEQIG